MSQVENVKLHEEEAIEELRSRIENVAPPHISEDTFLLYRFLKARDFDVNKAEAMLSKHLIWRKVFQVDTILEDFKVSPIFLQYIHGAYLGEDKEGSPVQYVPSGMIETKDVVKSFKDINYFKHWVWTIENNCANLRKANLRTGKNASKFTYIIDLSGAQFSNMANPTTAAHYAHIAQIYQDNYPERLKSFYIINAPNYYVTFYNIVKRVLAAEVIRKIHVFGQTGWKEELLNVIDADVLPGFLGGTRTDPDGNPLCNTFVFHGSRIPPEYFLSKEARTFKDRSQVKRIIVPAKKSQEIYVEVEEKGSILECEYEVDNKDIGLGLYFEDLSQQRTEILPIYRFDTTDGTDTCSYRCQRNGKYVIVFDNAFSWITSKEVSYRVEVKKSPA